MKIETMFHSPATRSALEEWRDAATITEKECDALGIDYSFIKRCDLIKEVLDILINDGLKNPRAKKAAEFLLPMAGDREMFEIWRIVGKIGKDKDQCDKCRKMGKATFWNCREGRENKRCEFCIYEEVQDGETD